jgi:hypothetical protein
MRLTVGSLPPSVYWRRRALVLGAALLGLFLVAQACMAANAAPGGETAGDPPPTGASTTGALSALPSSPAGDPSPGVVDTSDGEGAEDQPDPPPVGEECTDEDMLITAEAGRTEFAPGEPVRFTIRIRNDSGRACVRDIGGGQREIYLIEGTGASKVWSTRLCGAPTGSEVTRLDPGFETTHFDTWSGHTSSTCEGDQPAGPDVTPGSYQLFARLGTAYSEPVAITIR